MDPRLVAGVLALVLVLLVVLVAGGGGSSGRGQAAAVADRDDPTPTPTATATPRPDPTPRPLTVAQRAVREQAARILDERGYTVVRLRDFQPGRTLQVLIGRSASGNRLAFFFVDGEYVGNDSASSSTRLSVRPGGDRTSVVLRYGVFTGSEAAGAAPTGDPVDVTFRWDGTRLEPSPALPPASVRSR